MKWHRQVLHVARKDLRESRWLLAAFAAAMAAVAAIWLRHGGPPGWGLLLQVGVVALGMVVFARLVQQDSPARVDAFWVSLPLDPRAVFGAKLVGLAVLLAIGLVAQTAVMLGFGVPGGRVPGLLVETVLVSGAWLCVAAALAALTRDLRSFFTVLVLSLVGIFAVGTVLAALMGPRGEPIDIGGSLRLPALALAGGLAILAHQFLTRDRRRGAWLALALWVIFSAVPPEPRAEAAVPVLTDSGEMLPLRVRLDADHREAPMPPGVALLIDTASTEPRPPTQVYELRITSAYLRLADGDSVRLPNLEQRYSISDHRDLDPQLRWLGKPAGAPPALRDRWHLSIPAGHVAALRSGAAELTVQGEVIAWEPRLLGGIPLRRGAEEVRDGRWIRVTDVEASPGNAPAVSLRIADIASRRSGDRLHRHQDPFRFPDFALVNRTRGEALALPMGSGGTSYGGVILPGPAARWSEWRGAPHPFGDDDANVDGAWLDGAEVVPVEWVQVARHPLRVRHGRGGAR